MRGVNFGGWFSQTKTIDEKRPNAFAKTIKHVETFLGEEDFQRVVDWGLDHVRLPLDWDVAFHANMSPREPILSRLDQAVNGLLASGLKVILDLHRCPGQNAHATASNDQKFFMNPALREDYKRIWSHLGERYGHRSGVLLDIMNEPVAPSAEVWNEVKDELVQHIRSVAPKAPLLVGSNLWSHADQFAKLTPVEDDNILYCFHLYNPVIFTHQMAPWMATQAFQVPRKYPGHYDVGNAGETRSALDSGLWDKSRLEQVMEPVFSFRDRHQAKLICNEFGVYMGGADPHSRFNWLIDTLELFRDNQVSWSYWNYKNMDFGIISKGESCFEHSPGYDNPDRTDYELLKILQAY